MSQNTSSKRGHYIKLFESAYGALFDAFLDSTDEKIRMGYIFEQVAKQLYDQKRDECRVLDIGVGEGTLAKKIAEGLKFHCNKLHYHGLEYLESYAKRANRILQETNISSVNIQHGSFLNQDDLAKMPNDADIILASHVAYYANNVTEFIFDLVNKTKDTTALIFFHQSEFSAISKWRKKYSVNNALSPQQAIHLALEARGFKVLELFYPAMIEFSNDGTVAHIEHIYTTVLKENFLLPEQKLKNLLEFIFHAPFEYLGYMGTLKDCLKKVEETLTAQDNHLIFWDVLQIATKVEIKNTDSPEIVIEKHAIPDSVFGIDSSIKEPHIDLVKAGQRINALNIGNLRPLEVACYEGNIEVVKELESQLSPYYDVEKPFIGLNLASRNGHIRVVEFLLEGNKVPDLSVKFDKEGATALHLAVQFRHPEIIELLLEAGINMHLKNANGFTALYLACSNEMPRIAQILLNHNNLVSSEKIGIAEVQLLIAMIEKQSHITMSNMLDTLRIRYIKMKDYCDIQKTKILYSRNIEYVTKYSCNIINDLIKLFATNECETHENATDLVSSRQNHLQSLAEISLKNSTVTLFIHKDFIDRQTYLQSVYHAIDSLDVLAGIVIGGALGVGKTTFARKLSLEWREKHDNWRIIWLDLDYEARFHNKIAEFFKMLGIDRVLTNEKITSFTQKELEEITVKLANSSDKYLFVLDNYFDYSSLKTVDPEDIKLIDNELKKYSNIHTNGNKISGIPCHAITYMANQLLEKLYGRDNAKILIVTRSAKIPLDNFSIRIELEPFLTQDIAKYFEVYGHSINSQNLLYIEETFGALPLQLAALKDSLKNTFDTISFNNLVEAKTKDPCIAVPTSSLAVLGKILKEEEKNCLIYLSYLGSNSIEFIESITAQQIDSVNRLETLSFIRLYDGHCVIQKDISTLLRNYFRCIDQERFYKVIEVIGDGLKKKFVRGEAVEDIEPHMSAINRFCIYANEDLGSKNYFKDWCLTVPLNICRDQSELKHYMQGTESCDVHNFFIYDVCYDTCSKDWTFEALISGQ